MFHDTSRPICMNMITLTMLQQNVKQDTEGDFAVVQKVCDAIIYCYYQYSMSSIRAWRRAALGALAGDSRYPSYEIVNCSEITPIENF